MFKKTLLYTLFSLCVLFTSCSTNSRNYSSNKARSSSKTKTYKKSSKSSKYSSKTTRKKSTKSSYSSEALSRNSIANFATNYKGTPYVYGGKSPSGFDCSGLITHVYNKKGVRLIGNSSSLSRAGHKISLKRAKKGDLLFFGRKGKVSHVAIIVQNKTGVLEVIHATSSRGVVKENISGSKYWTPKILFARDVLSSTDLAD